MVVGSHRHQPGKPGSEHVGVTGFGIPLWRGIALVDITVRPAGMVLRGTVIASFASQGRSAISDRSASDRHLFQRERAFPPGMLYHRRYRRPSRASPTVGSRRPRAFGRQGWLTAARHPGGRYRGNADGAGSHGLLATALPLRSHPRHPARST